MVAQGMCIERPAKERPRTALRFDVLIGTYRSGAGAGVAFFLQKTERKTAAIASLFCYIADK